MFLINSRSPLFLLAVNLIIALLLPKLQSHFAEFLNCCYLNHLSIFNLPFCIDLVRFFFSRDLVLTIGYTFVFTLGADLLNVVYPFVENLGFLVILFSIFLVTHANIIALKKSIYIFIYTST